jgi:hypothetical protein
MRQQKQRLQRSKRPAVAKSEPKQVAEQDKPQLPRPTTEEEWRAHWKAQNQLWRTEPEIVKERQEYLDERRSIKPDWKQGIFPFKDIKLSRADIEWLLATHENGCGPIDWNDESQRNREGLDLCGADLSGNENQRVDLSGLPLSHLIGGPTIMEWVLAPEDQEMSIIRLISWRVSASKRWHL